MAENEEKNSKIILDKEFWLEPSTYGWILKYKYTDPETGKVSEDQWYPGSIPASIASYMDKKLSKKVSTTDEPYTADEILDEIKVTLRGLDKRFGYLKNIQSESIT